jgi:RES domain-containing protein
MLVYRLSKRQYSATVLSGNGGLESDGRWHSQGRRIVYCATSEALAIIELRVHVGRFIPRVAFVMHEIELPDGEAGHLSAKDLPKHWNRVPHSKLTQAIGDAWLAKSRHLALQVPSIHSGTDRNVLLNPAHESFRDVRVVLRRAWPAIFAAAHRSSAVRPGKGRLP